MTLYLVKIKPLKLHFDCLPFFLLLFKFAAHASFPWKLDRYSYGVPFGMSTSVNSETMLLTSGLVKVVDF